MGEGHYRIRGGFGLENSVCLRYPDGRELEISESHYRDMGFQPPFEHLEWQAED